MSFVCTRMSLVCHAYVLYVTRMSSLCHSYVVVCSPYVTGMYKYVTRMSLVCTCMSPVFYSYVLICHSYFTRMYSYAIRMPLVCTHVPFVCHSYVLVCHSYVTRLWFYHEPLKTMQFKYGAGNYSNDMIFLKFLSQISRKFNPMVNNNSWIFAAHRTRTTFTLVLIQLKKVGEASHNWLQSSTI